MSKSTRWVFISSIPKDHIKHAGRYLNKTGQAWKVEPWGNSTRVYNLYRRK